jgi:hypothetical protein
MNEGFRDTKQGAGSAMMDMYFVYKFTKFIALPFEEWEAFKLGIIDEKGNVIKKNRTTADEKNNYTFFHRLVRNLKKLLEKVPGMKSKLGKAVAAYFLFKEQMVKHGTNGEMLDEAFIEYCNESMPLNESMQIDTLMKQHMLVENIR